MSAVSPVNLDPDNLTRARAVVAELEEERLEQIVFASLPDAE
jgi:hypothetical protein